MIIFLVSGFWHGANWTFIVWGAYHAFLFFPLMMLKMNRKYTDVVAKGRIIPSIKEFVQMSITFMLALIGWIIFRADNIGSALDYIARMCSYFGCKHSVWKESIALHISVASSGMVTKR